MTVDATRCTRSLRATLGSVAVLLMFATTTSSSTEPIVSDAPLQGHVPADVAPELERLFQQQPEIGRASREFAKTAPSLPGLPWRVHDLRRPQPRIVRGMTATTAPPPDDAVVLFNGASLGAWTGTDIQQWSMAAGVLTSGGRLFNHIETRESFGSLQLHVEWAAPTPAQSAWQFRGNSGVLLMKRFEVQILDSWDSVTYPDGQAGALYGQWPPEVNASLPPGVWQSYDILFDPPEFDAERLTRPALITVVHNGVLLHGCRAFLGPTSHRKLVAYSPVATTAPIALQDHGDAGSRVSFRNVWVRRLPPRGACGDAK